MHCAPAFGQKTMDALLLARDGDSCVAVHRWHEQWNTGHPLTCRASCWYCLQLLGSCGHSRQFLFLSFHSELKCNLVSEPIVGSSSVRFFLASPQRSVRLVLLKNMVRVRCVRFGLGSIPISTLELDQEEEDQNGVAFWLSRITDCFQRGWWAHHTAEAIVFPNIGYYSALFWRFCDVYLWIPNCRKLTKCTTAFCLYRI